MKILFVAVYFPPVNNSASIRSLYYANKLRQLGNEVGVLTCEYNEDHVDYDKSLLESIDEGVRVYRESAGFIYSRTYSRKGAKDNVSGKSGVKRRVKSWVKNCMAIPDSFVFWRMNAVKRACKLVERGEYDVVFSMHELPSCHMVAHAIKSRFPGIIWAGYWSDPWTVGNGERSGQPPVRKSIERRMEKSVVEMTDVCFFTSEKTRNAYVIEFGIEREKTDIVYRGYDEEYYGRIRDIGAPKGIEEGKINIVYTGAVYTQMRDVNPLIEALEWIRSNRIDLYERLNVVMVGEVDDMDAIKGVEDIEVLKLKGRTSFEKALRYIMFSDVLLLWGNRGSSQIPGKIYEYVGTDNCILTILGDESDPLEGVMGELQRGPVVVNSGEEIRDALAEIVDLMDSGCMPYKWTRIRSEYEWGSVARDIEKKIERAIRVVAGR